MCSEQTCTHGLIRNDGFGSDYVFFPGLSTVRRRYSTWKEQVERDQCTLFSSFSDRILRLCTSLMDPTVAKSSAAFVFEDLWCKCSTLCSRGNSQWASACGPWNAFEDLQDSSIDTFSDVELHKHVGYYSCSELLSFIVRMEINTFFLRTLGKKRSCKC